MRSNLLMRHRHTQTAPLEVWRIAHGLNLLAPMVSVSIMHLGARHTIEPKDIEVIDENTVDVHFSIPRTGSAVVR